MTRLVFVSAAWRRHDVTRLALAQRAHLCGELVELGINATQVIVADDENLDVAGEFGFPTIERSNDELGRKFNDGIEWALTQWDADYVVLIGSDDWVHRDLFTRLPAPVADAPLPTPERPVVIAPLGPEVLSGHQIALVDLSRGVLRHCRGQGRWGVIPWVIPSVALHRQPRPLPNAQGRGIDGALASRLRPRPYWVFHDPHDLCRVDFKSSVNLNSYEAIAHAIGVGEEVPAWSTLAERYPSWLVHLASEVAA